MQLRYFVTRSVPSDGGLTGVEDSVESYPRFGSCRAISPSNALVLSNQLADFGDEQRGKSSHVFRACDHHLGHHIAAPEMKALDP